MLSEPNENSDFRVMFRAFVRWKYETRYLFSFNDPKYFYNARLFSSFSRTAKWEWRWKKSTPNSLSTRLKINFVPKKVAQGSAMTDECPGNNVPGTALRASKFPEFPKPRELAEWKSRASDRWTRDCSKVEAGESPLPPTRMPLALFTGKLSPRPLFLPRDVNLEQLQLTMCINHSRKCPTFSRGAKSLYIITTGYYPLFPLFSRLVWRSFGFNSMLAPSFTDDGLISLYRCVNKVSFASSDGTCSSVDESRSGQVLTRALACRAFSRRSREFRAVIPAAEQVSDF